MDKQSDEKPRKSIWLYLKKYKNALICGVAGIFLCIVMFVFAGLPLNPNQETFNTSQFFIRLIIIMFGIPFVVCTVNIFALNDRYCKTHPNDRGVSDLMLPALISTTIVCVLSVLAKTVLIFGFGGIVVFGFQLGVFSGIFSRQAFDAAIKLKK